MELKKHITRYYQPVYATIVQKEESDEAIVPDSSPDIQSIVATTGLACLKDKFARDGRLEMSGVVKATVLYIPDGQQSMKKLELNLPFNHAVEHPAMDGDVIAHIVPTVLSAETRLLNPRKVQVTVVLSLAIDVVAPAEWEVCDGLLDDEHELQMLTDYQSAIVPIAVREKEFTVTDEIELPSSKPPIGELLTVNVTPSAREVKVIGNKLVFKGLAQLQILYNTPDNEAVATFEQELPFSQILEMDGLEENCDSTVDLQLIGLEIDLRTGISLDTRVLGITLPLTAYAVATLERRMEVLADVYSTTQDCKLTYKNYTFTQPGEREERLVPVRELIETGMGVQSVLDTAVALGTPSLHHGDESAVTCDAFVRVLYVSDDGSYATATRRLSIPCPVDGDAWIVKVKQPLEVSAAATQDGMEVRFGVEFILETVNEVQLLSLDDIELLPLVAEDAPRPSVVLRRVQAGEKLWNVAKRYKTTIEDIKAANQLEDGELSASKMLLIPKKR